MAQIVRDQEMISKSASVLRPQLLSKSNIKTLCRHISHGNDYQRKKLEKWHD
jgi:hypothetical protein